MSILKNKILFEIKNLIRIEEYAVFDWKSFDNKHCKKCNWLKKCRRQGRQCCVGSSTPSVSSPKIGKEYITYIWTGNVILKVIIKKWLTKYNRWPS